MSNRVEEFNKFIACDLMKFYITTQAGAINKQELVRASGLSRTTVDLMVKVIFTRVADV